MQFDNLPDSAVGFSNLLLAIGGVRNMTNLAEHWEELTEDEKVLLYKALDYCFERTTLATMPFEDIERISIALHLYAHLLFDHDLEASATYVDGICIEDLRQKIGIQERTVLTYTSE